MAYNTTEEIKRLEQERDRYKEALEDIVARNEEQGGSNLSWFSKDYCIAKKALEGGE